MSRDEEPVRCTEALVWHKQWGIEMPGEKCGFYGCTDNKTTDLSRRKWDPTNPKLSFFWILYPVEKDSYKKGIDSSRVSHSYKEQRSWKAV